MKDVYNENEVNSPKLAAMILEESEATLAAWRLAGCGPLYVRLEDGPNSPVGYPPAVFDNWVERNLDECASDGAKLRDLCREICEMLESS